MLCTNCHHREATVIMNVYLGDEKKRIRLCVECAQKQGLDTPALDLGKTLGRMIMILAGRQLTAKKSEEKDSDPEKTLCPCCGAGGGVHSLGNSDCPECNRRSIDRFEETLVDLKKKLQNSIENENYEEAAVLRDRILEMELKRKDVMP